jgi:hypothetical protein
MDLKSLSFPSLEQPTGWKPEIEQVKRWGKKNNDLVLWCNSPSWPCLGFVTNVVQAVELWSKHGAINLWREDKKIWSTHIFLSRNRGASSDAHIHLLQSLIIQCYTFIDHESAIERKNTKPHNASCIILEHWR